MKSYTYTELEMLTGEVLPERAVLSTLLAGGGNGGGAIVAPNCQAVTAVNHGLLGIVNPATNSSSMACAGSTVAAGS
ncbi:MULTISPECIES: hypothetical protein [Actinomadura]|uniref:Uncharacterized protein n=1 Tax=Actinomadura livida TaxID=79909 RepID=A0A7W7IHS0_9ACTN|nr:MULTISPECIES: hypothetical protein [Actinomadura]MBB4777205.1 hypothetical protein [Actinomadura catellatispora]TDB96610.1 hypothetical protein E1266_09335 [Actinomadura sp. 7K534]GGU20887.1 hypothetical protein GCM10010208_52410 [Actinomadura livida]